MTRNNFYAAMYQANILYGVSFTNEDDFAEIGLIAWGKIGNKNTRLYTYDGPVDCHTLTLDLPCNCDIIEAVVAPHEDWNYTWNTLNYGEWASAWTEEYIERMKREHDPLYTHGHFIHYKRLGDKLYFQHPYPMVHILYKGIELDEDGLPYLNDKEVSAIATFVAWTITFKEAMLTMNLAKMQMAQLLEKRWYTLCDLARTPEEMSQNDMDEIANAKSRWTTVKYGRSYKPVMK